MHYFVNKFKLKNKEAVLVKLTPPFDLDTAFQVPEMQGWLSDQAKKGLILKKCVGGFYFEYGDPINVSYRIEPALKDRFAARERKDRFEKAGWALACCTEYFNIFLAGNEAVKSDPHEDAASLVAVYKEQRYESILRLILEALIFPAIIFLALSFGGSITTSTDPNSGDIVSHVFEKTIVIISSVLLILVFLFDLLGLDLAQCVNLMRVIRQLKNNKKIEPVQLPKYIKVITRVRNTLPTRFIQNILSLFNILYIAYMLLFFR